MLMEPGRISKKLWGNLLGKSGIFFQNAYGILGETLGVFGEILVKVSLLKRASRSHAKTGFFGGSKSMAGAVFSYLLREIKFWVQVCVLEGSQGGFGGAFGRSFGSLWDTLGDLGGPWGSLWAVLE